MRCLASTLFRAADSFRRIRARAGSSSAGPPTASPRSSPASWPAAGRWSSALLDAVSAALDATTAARVVDLGGRLSLRELAALTARARLFFGVDSAPMHIASATGTPAVALFGPSSEVAWGPWRVPHRVVTSAHPCRPCGLDGCGGSKVSECLTTLPLDRVHAALVELLRETGSDGARGRA